MAAQQQPQAHLQELTKNRKDTRLISSATATVDARDDDKTLLLDTTANGISLVFGAGGDCVGVSVTAMVVGAGHNVTLVRGAGQTIHVAHSTGSWGQPDPEGSSSFALVAPPKGFEINVKCTGGEWFVNTSTPFPLAAVVGPYGEISSSTLSSANHGGLYTIDLTTEKTLTMVPASEAPGTIINIYVMAGVSDLVVVFAEPWMYLITYPDPQGGSTLMNYPASLETEVLSRTISGISTGSHVRLSSTGENWILEITSRPAVVG